MGCFEMAEAAPSANEREAQGVNERASASTGLRVRRAPRLQAATAFI
jgi:hypothetical protein